MQNAMPALRLRLYCGTQETIRGQNNHRHFPRCDVVCHQEADASVSLLICDHLWQPEQSLGEYWRSRVVNSCFSGGAVLYGAAPITFSPTDAFSVEKCSFRIRQNCLDSFGTCSPPSRYAGWECSLGASGAAARAAGQHSLCVESGRRGRSYNDHCSAPYLDG
jgi:hypothetical protein